MGCLSSCFKRCNRIKFPQVYVLQLENNKYYVGESNNVDKRIKSHKKGNGSAWTRKYSVIRGEKPFTEPQKHLWELTETLERIKLHGIENVRGSMFTSPYPLKDHEKIMAAQLYCELKGLCRKCGSPDHFITHCNSDKLEDWVHNFGGELQFNSDKNRYCIRCSKNINETPGYFRYCSECYLRV